MKRGRFSTLRQMLGDLARWGVGVVLGGLYGALRAETGLVDLRGGLIWGAGLYDLAGKGLARALDLSPALPERGLPDRALHWGESLAYGLTTAAATQLLARPWRTGLLIALGAAGWTYAQSQRSDPALQTLLGGAERPAEQGHSPVASVPHGGGMKATHTVTVNRPPAEVYRFWRNFENLPRFMDHLERVTVLSDSRSRWRAKAPLGTNVEWEATIINDVADELIAWQSVPGSEIGNAGSVRFTPAPGGRGTEVRVSLSYDPPAGQLGTAIARLLGEEPHAQVAADLRRFKEVMEAGEVPVAGQQPHAHPGA